jgi:hypothetical protein
MQYMPNANSQSPGDSGTERSEDSQLCPFSKPILGQWCRCDFARLEDRCSGKMICAHPGEHRATCLHLTELLKKNARFSLNLSNTDNQISHAQAMKIKCGGLLGMQRILETDTQHPPSVVGIVAEVRERYGSLEDFPFGEIIRDIAGFSHRNKKSNKRS